MAEKRWIVVQVPYGGGYSSLNLAHTPNTRLAPSALKKEFMRQKIFIADNFYYWDGIFWHELDIEPGHQNNSDGWEKMNKSVVSYLKTLGWQSDTNILFLGGSHSITASTYYGLTEICKPPARIGLIVLDAHPDCCNKAIWPIHSDWLRWLAENHYVRPENILILGLRQTEKSEKEFLSRLNIKHYEMQSVKDAENFTVHDISAMNILEKFRKLKAVYMTIDIDVASGAFAPGTGCPSPGGLTDRELISLVKQFKTALPNLKFADIVEINPLNWWRKKILGYDITVDLGVRLIKEIVS